MNEKETLMQSVMMEDSGCSASEPFALRVLGDSMEPEFKDGCIIIIDPASNAENGAYVIAEIEGEFIFRQLVREEGKMYLQALNSGYKRLEIGDAGVIRGVIVQRAGTRRKEHKHYL